MVKKKKFSYFIDLGAAEGYHIISLLKKKIFKKGIAFELNKKSREILKKNSQINNLHSKIQIYGEANFLTLSNILKDINPRNLFF